MKTKKVSDELALELTKRFLGNTCHGDALRIKTSELSRFIEFETGHTYTQHTLRRCIPVREYIKAEQEKAAKDLELQVIVYKPLDVRQLVRDNTSPDKLVEAISEVDHYYKQVSDYAFRMLKERDKARNEIEELKTALAELTEEQLRKHILMIQKLANRLKAKFSMNSQMTKIQMKLLCHSSQ